MTYQPNTDDSVMTYDELCHDEQREVVDRGFPREADTLYVVDGAFKNVLNYRGLRLRCWTTRRFASPTISR